MDSIGGDSGASFGLAKLLAAWAAATSRRFQYCLDKANPHVGRRWAALGLLTLAYVLRVAFVHGFYVVSYGLAIWILNLLIAFLSPQVDPEIEELLGNGGDTVGPTLPTKSSDEFRPFVRRLPEFKFWYSITKAFCIAFIMTFFSVFDVPVFWPVLVFYWLVLFMLTMKRQILHMLKYKYVPFSFGKRRYTGKKGASTDDAKVSVGHSHSKALPSEVAL